MGAFIWEVRKISVEETEIYYFKNEGMKMKPQKLGVRRLSRNLDKILLLFFMVFMAIESA